MVMKNVSNEVFVKACLSSKNIQEVALATGLKISTVSQRRSKLRSMGLALPEYSRGGNRVANATDLEAISKLIAESTGKSVDDVKAEGEALKEKHAKRTATKS